jgi:2-keto-4-pentenoate hydratase/2-oxohepta-3-ene-1,7-dioic acid hydratase in catechol pathway
VGGETVAGLVSADRLNEVAGEWEDHLARWAQGEPDLELTGRSWQLEQGDVLVPASEQARGLFCVGMNYGAHRDEVDASLGQYEKGWAVIFSKMSESLAAAGQVLELTAALSSEFDWEVELGVVIGQGGRRISGDRAFDHVSGYTLVNDVTARDVQRAHSQWFLGKNVHRSSPVGPWVIYRDDLGYPPEVSLRLSVNDDVKQHASTADMIHAIPDLIEAISAHVELQVGDIIATGSPAGVGFTRVPPEFLASGDIMRAEIVGFLSLENAIS